jgi:AraC-like DNA-binding protein
MAYGKSANLFAMLRRRALTLGVKRRTMEKSPQASMPKGSTKKAPAEPPVSEGGSQLDYYTPHPDQPLQPEDGFRVVPTFGGAEGYRELVHLREGFDLVVGDVLHREDAEIAVEEQALLKFHYRLTGAGRIGIEGSGEVDVEKQTTGLLLHSDGVTKHEYFLAGEREQSVTLICSPGFLAETLHDMDDSLPQVIVDYLSGKPADFYHVSMPLRADMAAAINALLHCELTGALRRMHAESRSLELLLLGVQALMDSDSGAERSDRGLTRHDLDCLQKARQILERDFIDPPTIAALGHDVGMNEAKLMRCFKQLFGQTIFDFAQHLRMVRAKELLETTDRSITEIAFDVGYEYSSNFATAFKRHYGITPKAARDATRV